MSKDGSISYVPPSDGDAEDEDGEDRDDGEHIVFIDDPKPRRE
jgi:hypothetical protein